MYVYTYGLIYSKSVDQPGKVANPTRGKLIFPCPRSRLRVLASRDGSAVPSSVSSLISILRPDLLTSGIPPEFRGGVHLFI